jgi:hypothetical protein
VCSNGARISELCLRNKNLDDYICEISACVYVHSFRNRAKLDEPLVSTSIWGPCQRRPRRRVSRRLQRYVLLIRLAWIDRLQDEGMLTP